MIPARVDIPTRVGGIDPRRHAHVPERLDAFRHPSRAYSPCIENDPRTNAASRLNMSSALEICGVSTNRSARWRSAPRARYWNSAFVSSGSPIVANRSATYSRYRPRDGGSWHRGGLPDDAADQSRLRGAIVPRTEAAHLSVSNSSCPVYRWPRQPTLHNSLSAMTSAHRPTIWPTDLAIGFDGRKEGLGEGRPLHEGDEA